MGSGKSKQPVPPAPPEYEEEEEEEPDESPPPTLPPAPPEPEPEPKPKFVPFTEFPSPALLWQARRDYNASGEVDKVEVGNDGVPHPFPPSVSSVELLAQQDFSTIDKHAADESVLQHAEMYYPTLVAHLTEPARSELEKLRAFFVFIGSQNPGRLKKHLAGRRPNPASPLSHLCAIFEKDSVLLYNGMLQNLCKAAKIPCRLESCRIKASDYKIGSSVKHATHKICLVYVDGSWRFVDQLWGSQSVSGEESDDWTLVYSKDGTEAYCPPGSVQYKLKEEWFLPDPVKLVYTHLVENPEAQLLARPVTTDEFDQMASLHKGFFHLGLTGINPPTCSLKALKNGTLDIKFGLNTTPEKSYKLYHGLFKMTIDPDNDRLKGHSENDFTMTYCSGEEMTLHMEFPWIGRYRLDVHGAHHGESAQWVCQYVIQVDRPCFRGDILLLPVSPTPLGISIEAHMLGVVPVQDGKNGVVTTSTGNATLQFKVTDTNVLLKPRLKGDHMIRQCKDKEGVVSILVMLTKPGYHTLFIDIEAKGVRKTGRYILSAEQESTDLANPRDFPASLGETDKIGHMCLGKKTPAIDTISHHIPVFEAPEVGHVCIEMSSDDVIIPEFHAPCSREKKQALLQDYICLETEGRLLKISLRFPVPGICALNLFGGNKKTPLYQYAIIVHNPDLKAVPFPILSPLWPPGSKVNKPHNGALDEGESVRFDLEVPGFLEVVVKQSAGLNAKLTRQKGGRWTGTVNINRASSKLWVYTDMSTKKSEYIISYKILNSKERSERDQIRIARVKEATVYNNTHNKRVQKSHTEAEDRKRKRDKGALHAQRDFDQHRNEYKAKEIEMEVATARQELREAMDLRIVSAIHNAVDNIEEDDQLREPLQSDVEKARSMIEKMERRVTSDYNTLSQSTMIEIARYREPPYFVHVVLQAALLLLGEDEETTKEWLEVQRLLNKGGEMGMFGRLNNFDIERTHPEVAARAKEIIATIEVDDLEKKNKNTMEIYHWINNILIDIAIDELDSQPANSYRQKELLGRLPGPPPPSLAEVSSKTMEDVYIDDTPRKSHDGIRKPASVQTPWAMDITRIYSGQRKRSPVTARRASSVPDFRREVEVRLRSSRKSRTAGIWPRNKTSPYEFI